MRPFAELATRPEHHHDAIRCSSKNETYVAAVLVASVRFDITSSSPAEYGVDQVPVRVRGYGACASGLPAWEGREWLEYTMAAGAPGYENRGEIVSVGSAISGGKSGFLIQTQGTSSYQGRAYSSLVFLTFDIKNWWDIDRDLGQ